MMPKLVEYRYMTKPGGRPRLSPGCLYQYIWAQNGIYIFAENDYFEALMPLKTWKAEEGKEKMPELAPAQAYLHLSGGKVPASILRTIVLQSRQNSSREILFYITGSPSSKLWFGFKPEQDSGAAFCRALEEFSYIPIELHSHNRMGAFFSDTDNKDENGLRIYAVIGRVDQPVMDIRVRVSVYGHYWTIPYELVFEVPAEVRNA